MMQIDAIFSSMSFPHALTAPAHIAQGGASRRQKEGHEALCNESLVKKGLKNRLPFIEYSSMMMHCRKRVLGWYKHCIQGQS